MPIGALRVHRKQLHRTRFIVAPTRSTPGTHHAKVYRIDRNPDQKQANITKHSNNMSLISIVITLIVVGVLLWLVNTYIPMDGKIKKVLNIVVMVVVVLWLLNVFGVLGHLRDVRVTMQTPSLDAPNALTYRQRHAPCAPHTRTHTHTYRDEPSAT